MGDGGGETLTDQQKKWFASVKEGLVRETGKSLDEWVAIARTCPETAHRARVNWFKDHGLGQNRASVVLAQAFPAQMDWDNPQAARDALWTDPASRAIFEAVEAQVAGFDNLVTGQRKSFSAWSRKAQFAAIKPIKGGAAVLGLAVPPDADPRLQTATGKDGWSDRLKSRLPLTSAADVDDGLAALLKQAFATS